jgi:hypothetical protein
VILLCSTYLLTKIKDAQFSQAENFPTPNWTSPGLSVSSAVPSYPVNSYPGSESFAINSGMAPTRTTLRDPISEAHHDLTSQGFLLSGRNFESNQQLMGGQLCLGQSQLGHFPTTAFGSEDLQQVLGVQPGFPRLNNQIYGDAHTDSQVGNFALPGVGLTQSSSSSFSPFNVSTATPSGFDYNLDIGTNPSYQVTCRAFISNAIQKAPWITP